MSEQSESLYASHIKIYPKYQQGFFRKIKWISLFILLGFYYLIPLIRWDRGGDLPTQAVLFDLPHRKFYIFDLVIWPQDIFLLTFLLIVSAVGLFFITALAGRVFCGYMCFQTVWTDLFLYVENFFEGSPRQRRMLDEHKFTGKWFVRKAGKHFVWLLIGLATGGAFVFYFADAPTLFKSFLDGSAPYAAWFSLGFLTITTYVFAGFAREQVCIYMCPYARFQGAMFDADTLIVAYDEKRGEPRESNKKIRGKENSGDCIDCHECVRVCPTGIDIRDGQQYQCITCAACIDACDEVMDHIGKPHGLVRYTALSALENKKARLFRPRVLFYGGILLLAVLMIIVHLASRASVDLNVIRHRKPVYITQSDGSIQNNFTIRVLNMTAKPQVYALGIEGLKNAELSVAAMTQKDDDGNTLLIVGPGKVEPFTAYVRSKDRSGGQSAITFALTAQDETGGQDRYESVFMRPE
ncbi:MAG: cytochrome c oxidase accessory protein CcoG [Magnetococcales bacterium]|nr:cytochrome c oxidase accessory protein CcoG [Magnetococcales bacterium]